MLTSSLPGDFPGVKSGARGTRALFRRRRGVGCLAELSTHWVPAAGEEGGVEGTPSPIGRMRVTMGSLPGRALGRV